MQIQKINDEIVRMLGRKLVRLERLVGKIFQVERDDQTGSGVNGRRHYMPVIRVRQVDRRDYVFEAGDDTVTYRMVHVCTRPFQTLKTEVGAIRVDVTYPLIVNHVAPARPEQIRQRQMHQ